MAKKVILISHRRGREYELEPMTLEEAHKYFKYTLEVGQSWQHEKGNKKINLTPRTFDSLVTNVNNAKNNAALNGWANSYYTIKAIIN